MHTGSDILDAEVFLGATEILLNAAKSFKDLRFIDFGSGFKVPYKKGDIETNVEVLGELISQLRRFFRFGPPPHSLVSSRTITAIQTRIKTMFHSHSFLGETVRSPHCWTDSGSSPKFWVTHRCDG